MDPGDLLLVDDASLRGVFISELKTPLVCTFGLNVADVSADSLDDLSYVNALRSSFDDVYLVSSAAVPPTGFAAVDSVRLRVKAFQHGTFPVTELYTRIDTRLYLYRLEYLELSAGTRVDFRSGGLGVAWLQRGWSAPEWWGVWAIGNSATLRIRRRDLPVTPRIVALKLRLNAFVSAQHPEQNVSIRVDGREVQTVRFHYPEALEREVDVPLASSESPTISVEFVMPQAAAPASVGPSRETRVLGIGLKSAELVGAGKSR
jgi:hypothetical protein